MAALASFRCFVQASRAWENGGARVNRLPASFSGRRRLPVKGTYASALTYPVRHSWWVALDSNQGSLRPQIYSLVQIAASASDPCSAGPPPACRLLVKARMTHLIYLKPLWFNSLKRPGYYNVVAEGEGFEPS